MSFAGTFAHSTDVFEQCRGTSLDKRGMETLFAKLNDGATRVSEESFGTPLTVEIDGKNHSIDYNSVLSNASTKLAYEIQGKLNLDIETLKFTEFTNMARKAISSAMRTEIPDRVEETNPGASKVAERALRPLLTSDETVPVLKVKIEADGKSSLTESEQELSILRAMVRNYSDTLESRAARSSSASVV